MCRWLLGPGVAAPLPILCVLLPLLLMVNFQQVPLHAVGDLWAQVPDEHTAVEAKARCGRVRNTDYESHLTEATSVITAKTPFPGTSQKIQPISLVQGLPTTSGLHPGWGLQGTPANQDLL